MNPIDGLHPANTAHAVAHQYSAQTGAETKQTPDPAANNRDSVSKAVKIVNETLGTLRRDESHFSVDDELGKLVVRIINTDTKELIRQIPSEEVLNLSKKMVEITKLLYGNNA